MGGEYYIRAAPVQLCCFILVLFILVGFTWYVNYESIFSDIMDKMRVSLMVFPVLLLVALHWLSSTTEDERMFTALLPEQDSIHRAGGSPWGVALLLLFLIFMLSYHTSIRESWWPFLS